MAITNQNSRGFPKGLREIRYPSESMIHRFVSKDYVGEISLDNETGLFKFNPPLDLGDNSSVPEADIGVYDPARAYIAGNVFVTYSNSSSPVTQFQTEAIYRCIEDAGIGESPEEEPTKWLIQGSSASTIPISGVQDLQQELDSRPRFSEFNGHFTADQANRSVKLNIDYVTVSDYFPSSDIPPAVDADVILSATDISVLESATYDVNVKLSKKPVDNVRIGLIPSDAQVLTTSVLELNFTPDNWNTPQTFTIIPTVDGDSADDTGFITVSISSTNDTDYDALTNKRIDVLIIDDFTARLIVRQQAVEVVEGEHFVVEVTTSTLPTLDVIFKVESSNTDIINPGNSFTIDAEGNARGFIDRDRFPDGNNFAFLTTNNSITEDTVVNITFSVLDKVGEPIYDSSITPVVLPVTVKNVVPPVTEVEIDGNTWRRFNEDLEVPSFSLIYGGPTDPNYDENLATYGRLYSKDGIQPVLDANPGWRLPTFSELRSLQGVYGNSGNETSISFTINATPLSSNNVVWTDLSGNILLDSDLILGQDGLGNRVGNLNLLPGGRYINQVGQGYYGLSYLGNYWYAADDGSGYGLYTIQAVATDGVIIRTRITVYKDLVSTTALGHTYYYSMRLIKDI